ncbi:MAG: hypothetical protein QME28_02430 [Candidatus Saccharicenans sp.]|nr:hypothetical protein [Candidatus Saccharicenans sp.]
MTERIIDLYLLGMEICEPQTHEEMALFPLKSQLPEGPDYITFSEALEQGVLEVTEVGPEGFVPELKAINRGKKAVLLLDGEELKGAKQNRVLNTTILVPGKSTITIPVSCVEAHRWHGQTLRMHASENVMASMIRRKKMEHVHNNLERIRSFEADQGDIWSMIDHLACSLETKSTTSAMSDIFNQKENEMESYLKSFNLIPGQKGLLVFLSGNPLGLDFISRESAFARLYRKLLRSYVLEALALKAEKTGRKDSSGSSKKESTPQFAPDKEQARAFLEEATRCQEKRFRSIGLGTDCRYRSETIIGAALEVDGSIPHLAFFPLNDSRNKSLKDKDDENFPGLRVRKSYLFSRE